MATAVPSWIRLTRAGLAAMALVFLAFVVNLTLVSRLEHRVAQIHAFQRFRNDVANGVAPVGGLDSKGHLVAAGAPVALIKIPQLHVREVVGEGTTGRVLMSGPGHLRRSVLPGQAGTSVIFGRAAAYGGPFGSIHRLRKGDSIVTTTQVGETTFKVVDVRRPGDTFPVLQPGAARVTLVTADGSPFLPSGTLYVDADSTSPEPANAIPAVALTAAERALGRQTDLLWQLILLLQLLILLAVGAVWAARRWSPTHAWIVFLGPVLLVGSAVGTQLNFLLPNLL